MPRKAKNKIKNPLNKAALTRGVKLIYAYKEVDNSELTNTIINESDNANSGACSSADSGPVIKHLIIKPANVNKTSKPHAEAMPRNRNPERPTTAVTVSNRFDPLAANADDEIEMDQSSSTTIQKPPTPIIISGKASNHRELITNIKNKTTGQFHIRYTANNMSLYLNNTADKKTIIQALNKEGAEYHTYTDAAEKTHAFVLRGLDHGPSPEQIKLELEQNHKIKAKIIYKLKNTARPLYMVVLNSTYRLKQLQQEIKYMDYTKITWDRYTNKKLIIQCHRCQQWGHATTNCCRQPKCLKCAQEHLTKECRKTKDTPARCTNCEGPHPANYAQCPVYLRKLQQREKIARQHQPIAAAYVPAPHPANNAWQKQSDAETATPGNTYKEQFPPLNHRQQDVQQSPPQVIANQNTSASVGHSDSVNARSGNQMPNHPTLQLQQLSEQYRILSSSINLGGMLQAIQNLNNLLKHCQSKAQKFTTFLNFLESIDSYDI